MVSESLGSLSSLYITSCGIEGKSPETLRSYTETLKLFMRSVDHLGLPSDPGSFRPADVYEFLGHVGSTGVSAITQWRRQRETRAFFSWLLRHDYISSNPFMKVKNIKAPQKIVQPFTADDIHRLLSYCDAGTRKGA
jgi:site-specific recombinase XerD